MEALSYLPKDVRRIAAISGIKEDLQLCLNEEFDNFKKLLDDTRGLVDINYVTIINKSDQKP